MGGRDELIFRRTEGVSFAIENPKGRIIEIISNNSEGPLKSVGKCQFRVYKINAFILLGDKSVCSLNLF